MQGSRTAGRRLVVGVIGGMGPLATVEAYRLITKATPAARDQDHLHVIVDSDPSVPDRTAALLDGGPSPLPWLVASATRLTGAGAEVLALPCNTAHAFHRELQASTSAPVVHMIREAAVGCVDGEPRGLLATQGTTATGLYQAEFEATGTSLLIPTDQEQQHVNEAIRLVKSGAPLEAASAHCRPVAAAMFERGASGLVLGCTEISLLRELLGSAGPIVDALDVMARVTVDMAMGERRSPDRSRMARNVT